MGVVAVAAVEHAQQSVIPAPIVAAGRVAV